MRTLPRKYTSPSIYAPYKNLGNRGRRPPLSYVVLQGATGRKGQGPPSPPPKPASSLRANLPSSGLLHARPGLSEQLGNCSVLRLMGFHLSTLGTYSTGSPDPEKTTDCSAVIREMGRKGTAVPVARETVASASSTGRFSQISGSVRTF